MRVMNNGKDEKLSQKTEIKQVTYPLHPCCITPLETWSVISSKEKEHIFLYQGLRP